MKHRSSKLGAILLCLVAFCDPVQGQLAPNNDVAGPSPSTMPSVVQPVSNSTTQDSATGSDTPNKNPIDLYLLGLTVSSVAVANPGATVSVQCEDGNGAVFKEVKMSMTKAESRENGVAKFTSLNEYVGYIQYGGGISCKVRVIYMVAGIPKTVVAINAGDGSCWFYYSYYSLKGDNGEPVDTWSCSVASGSYVLGCAGCSPGSSNRSPKGIWLNTTAIILTVFVSLLVSILIVSITGYLGHRRRQRLRAAQAAAARLPEDAAGEINLKPPNFIEASAPSAKLSSQFEGPVVILNYGSTSTPRARFHRGTYSLGVLQSQANGGEEYASPLSDTGKRKRTRSTEAAEPVQPPDEPPGGAPPVAWVLMVNRGRISDVAEVPWSDAAVPEPSRLSQGSEVQVLLIEQDSHPEAEAEPSTGVGAVTLEVRPADEGHKRDESLP